MGKILIVIGVILIIAGVMLNSGIKIPFGRLPGDIAIQKENFSFYLPITSSIIISIILSLIILIIRKFG